MVALVVSICAILELFLHLLLVGVLGSFWIIFVERHEDASRLLVYDTMVSHVEGRITHLAGVSKHALALRLGKCRSTFLVQKLRLRHRLISLWWHRRLKRIGMSSWILHRLSCIIFLNHNFLIKVKFWIWIFQIFLLSIFLFSIALKHIILIALELAINGIHLSPQSIFLQNNYFFLTFFWQFLFHIGCFWLLFIIVFSYFTNSLILIILIF